MLIMFCSLHWRLESVFNYWYDISLPNQVAISNGELCVVIFSDLDTQNQRNYIFVLDHVFIIIIVQPINHCNYLNAAIQIKITFTGVKLLQNIIRIHLERRLPLLSIRPFYLHC